MDKDAMRRRVSRVRRRLAELKADALVVTKGVSVRYITGFTGDDSWAVVTPSAVHLVTDSRYTEQAGVECMLCRIVERKDNLAEAVGRLLGRSRSVQTIAVEKSLTLGAYGALRKHIAGRLKPVDGVLEALRRTKECGEVSAIRKAAAISIRALRATLCELRGGMTESELAGRLDFEIRKLGATSGFETIVAFGANASRPHHHPGSRRLRSRDTILIDYGAKYQGYCCDITRCFAFGRASTSFVRAYEVVDAAQAAAIRAIRAGARLRDVDAAPRDTIREAGLPVYGHGTGHGIGLEIHEEPFMKPQAKGRLEAGQVVTVEPGMYMPGKLGVRIEDDVLVTEDGCEMLTAGLDHSFELPA